MMFLNIDSIKSTFHFLYLLFYRLVQCIAYVLIILISLTAITVYSRECGVTGLGKLLEITWSNLGSRADFEQPETTAVTTTTGTPNAAGAFARIVKRAAAGTKPPTLENIGGCLPQYAAAFLIPSFLAAIAGLCICVLLICGCCGPLLSRMPSCFTKLESVTRCAAHTVMLAASVLSFCFVVSALLQMNAEFTKCQKNTPLACKKDLGSHAVERYEHLQQLTLYLVILWGFVAASYFMLVGLFNQTCYGECTLAMRRFTLKRRQARRVVETTDVGVVFRN